ncbi:MAG: hypothetical protein ACI35O_16495 [Bacillaceae bacterium]
MKKLYISLMLVSFLLLAACSSDTGTKVKSEGLNQVNLEKVQALMNGDDEGFLLVIKDPDEYYLSSVKKVAIDKGVNVSLYHTHQPEGANTKEIDNPNFEYANKLKGSRLYYIEDGEITSQLRVNSYTDSKLVAEIQNFIEVNQS